ncbi:MAG TPA: hypothetical protein VF297_05370 [Pyrinomonadaceae bacterium]
MSTGDERDDETKLPPDGWEWVRAKLEKCCPELTVKPRTDSLTGTPWEVMGWMHVLCQYAQAANRCYLHIAVEQEKRAVEAERQRDELRAAASSAAETILAVADLINDAVNEDGEIAGSSTVDPLMRVHGELLAASEP